MKAFLILEDGHIFEGKHIGSKREVISEIVFNTSMTGYLEILTDPSYAGQAVVMTYPLIGNYGICPSDMESLKAWPDGFIVRETSRVPSNFRSEFSLEEFLIKNDIPGISGVDTRCLTKILRESGTMNGMITTNENFVIEEVVKALKEYKVTGVVSRVSCKEKKVTTHEKFTPTDFEMAKMTYMASPEMKEAIEKATKNGVCLGEIALSCMQGTAGIAYLNKLAEDENLVKTHYKVALMDFGSKKNIEHCLLKRGCEVTVYPADTLAEEILEADPDGIMLSNGPGDPKDVSEAIEMLKDIIGKVPLFGICLGHQLFALASGANTSKLKFGHRGLNHPVKNLATGKVAITSQNHGYAVEEESVENTDLEITHVALNDGTVEGLRHKKFPAFTVQYHPEASAGPEDANDLFEDFLTMIENFKKEGEELCQNA
ncbi:MAG TPA: carbamoyl phosphate synthase small subunit [Lachnoclostridium phytofermentans]|uniref:Carbamoyl phosphate synthase small chain n=1 Tax=Lachnoclostridium phytofermentans TaxID=66219 RepID=A0A3D2X7U9_9FIRM|nr:carbamoyl phosphate synthase small subunit [Lachnoclostridium phytofermentans]